MKLFETFLDALQSAVPLLLGVDRASGGERRDHKGSCSDCRTPQPDCRAATSGREADAAALRGGDREEPGLSHDSGLAQEVTVDSADGGLHRTRQALSELARDALVDDHPVQGLAARRGSRGRGGFLADDLGEVLEEWSALGNRYPPVTVPAGSS